MPPLSTAMLLAAAPAALSSPADVAEFRGNTARVLDSCNIAPRLSGALPARTLRAHAPRSGTSASFITHLDAIEDMMRTDPAPLRPSTWIGYWPTGPREVARY